jgi:septum formation protein
MRLVLASASPRRADLLRAAGFDFEVLPVGIDEQLAPGELPEQAVARLAAAKAEAALAKRPGRLVLGADTIVVIDQNALGKPVDQEDAKRMLRLLSGQPHRVLTGICLLSSRRRSAHVESTLVELAPLSAAEIDWYVGTGEPEDKAGAYAIQGLASRFIREIRGSYSNVMGLPIGTLYRLLKEWDCDILGI